MRRTHSAIFAGFVAVGLATVASGQSKTEVGGFTELRRENVAEAPGLEIVMGLIKRAGRSTGARHYHPGGEFGFVLEGAVTVTTESEPPVVLEAGSSFYQPPGEWHVVNTAIGGAQTVVFRVLKKGQPMIVAVD